MKQVQIKEAPLFGFKKMGLGITVILAFIMVGWLIYIRQAPPLTYSTGGATKTITLKDGSKITLRAYSSLTKIASTASTTTILLNGEAYFNVQNSSETSITIQTDHGEVRGDEATFNISTWGDSSRIFLVYGTLEVHANNSDETFVLSPNEFIALNPIDPPLIQTYRSDEVIHWLDHTLRFRMRTLASILQELSHHFNIELTASPDILATSFTGTVILSDREQTLLDLSLVLGGRFTPTGRGSYIFQLAE